jgi:hypothetical protein
MKMGIKRRAELLPGRKSTTLLKQSYLEDMSIKIIILFLKFVKMGWAVWIRFSKSKTSFPDLFYIFSLAFAAENRSRTGASARVSPLPWHQPARYCQR